MILGVLVCVGRSGDVRLPVGQKRRVAGVELVRSLGRSDRRQSSPGVGTTGDQTNVRHDSESD